jgi:hypothetical protein
LTTDGAVTVRGDASFSGNVVRTSGALEFGGNVALAAGKTLTLTTTGTVTLGAGKSINSALSAGSAKVVLTPAASGAILTVDNSDAKTIALSAQGLTITSGNLTVAADAELDTGDQAVTVTGTLTAASGATVNGITFTGGTDIAALDEDEVAINDLTIAAAATLSIPAGKTLTVEETLTVNGTLEIVGAGDVVLTAAATKVVLNAGGKLDVKHEDGKFGEGTQADTKVTVAASSASETPTKALVAKTGTVWTVTTDDDGDGTNVSSNKIILGTLALDFDGTAAVNGDACDASGVAAAGTLVVGAGTVITFIGS